MPSNGLKKYGNGFYRDFSLVKTFPLAHAHALARRTMFGATKERLEQLVEQGPEASLEQLFYSESLDSHCLEPVSLRPFTLTFDLAKMGEVS
jgi:hypothetical protein